jgi:non-ribosomal peptide synthetase component F
LTTPVQVVWRTAHLPVEEVHLRGDAAEAVAELVQRYHPRHFRIDLRRAPLLHVAIAQEPGSERWHAIETLHHIVSDHNSADILHAEIAGILGGREHELPQPQPFRNHIAAARSVEESAYVQYFRAKLGDIAEPTAPFGLTDAHVEAGNVQKTSWLLPRELTESLRLQARRHGVSVATLCHVAWGSVVARTTGREHVVFGTVLFGRMHATGAPEGAFGLYINTLPIRLDLDTRPVEALVRDAQTSLAELMRHEHASLSLAQRCSGVRPGAPLFTSLLNYRHIATVEQSTSSERQSGAGDIVSAFTQTNYPLMLAVNDRGTAITLNVHAAHPVRPERVCAMMQQALEALASTLAHAPKTPAGDLDILPATERQQLLSMCNDAHVLGALEVDEGSRIYILDRKLRLAPIGVAGELYIGGSGTARGQIARHAVTAERFVPDPFTEHAGARMNRTGVLARWSCEGAVEYLGRAETPDYLRSLAFWVEHLAGAPPAIDLPTDRPHVTDQSYRGEIASRRIEPRLTERILDLGQREGTSLFVTMLTGLAVVLHRLSGQDEVVIGSTFNARNTFALRVDLRDRPSCRALLARIRELTLRADEHQDVPFEQVVERLRPARELSRSPVFQVKLDVGASAEA